MDSGSLDRATIRRMNRALRFRAFLADLFGSSYVKLLEREVEELKAASVQNLAHAQERHAAEMEALRLDHATNELKIENSLAQMQTERDYFRARADRLELLLLPNPVARTPRPNSAATVASGRKSWEQVQREWADKMRAEAAEEAQKKGAPPHN